jgi:thioredoxin reductase (NADPH)
MSEMSPTSFDVIVVGGGAAGLTAAIYLSRFHLRTLVIDSGQSRAASIPLTRNHAGFPDGIAGRELLARMRAQASLYGTVFLNGTARDITRTDEGFTVPAAQQAFDTRAVLLATGVFNRRPEMPDTAHDAALGAGLIRYCPICDGYEVTDKRIAVLGSGEHGAKEALFLRGFSADITLIAETSDAAMPTAWQAQLNAAGIVQVEGKPGAPSISGDQITVETSAGVLSFDTLYPALGSDIRSELAVALGAQASEEGCLTVDAHQRTSVARLYSAGDVVLGLDQISHAMGEGGVAATTIRNDLADAERISR